MNYEIEQKLNNKADKYELHNVQNENRELKRNINELEREIGNLKSSHSNRYFALERLFNMLAEHPQLQDISNQIYELRGSL